VSFRANFQTIDDDVFLGCGTNISEKHTAEVVKLEVEGFI
jgi:hypothetical protein